MSVQFLFIVQINKLGLREVETLVQDHTEPVRINQAQTLPYPLIPQLSGAPATSLRSGGYQTLSPNLTFSLQGPLPSRRGSVALKETRVTLDPLEIQAEWATQDPLVPWGPLASRG